MVELKKQRLCLFIYISFFNVYKFSSDTLLIKSLDMERWITMGGGGLQVLRERNRTRNPDENKIYKF